MTASNPRYAIIIGAGPGGLTAAYELLTRTRITPIVIEKSDYVGGLCRTVAFKGNRMDVGGHRFFSKSDRVMEWWLRILPLEGSTADPAVIRYHGMQRNVSRSSSGPDPAVTDNVMLLRSRKSRIYHRGRLFEYPISMSTDTLLKLGLFRSFRIGVSYLRSALFPLQPENTLEQFLINRFGRTLYQQFFQSLLRRKVWGVPPVIA